MKKLHLVGLNYQEYGELVENFSGVKNNITID